MPVRGDVRRSALVNSERRTGRSRAFLAAPARASPAVDRRRSCSSRSSRSANGGLLVARRRAGRAGTPNITTAYTPLRTYCSLLAALLQRGATALGIARPVPRVLRNVRTGAARGLRRDPRDQASRSLSSIMTHWYGLQLFGMHVPLERPAREPTADLSAPRYPSADGQMHAADCGAASSHHRRLRSRKEWTPRQYSPRRAPDVPLLMNAAIGIAFLPRADARSGSSSRRRTIATSGPSRPRVNGHDRRPRPFAEGSTSRLQATAATTTAGLVARRRRRSAIAAYNQDRLRPLYAGLPRGRVRSRSGRGSASRRCSGSTDWPIFFFLVGLELEAGAQGTCRRATRSSARDRARSAAWRHRR